ncbi:MAG: helix-turn-helix domain-containing protein [Bacillota bacterium]|nr:helix-turn-helix domain-containing protein [Bacillota bacterium]
MKSLKPLTCNIRQLAQKLGCSAESLYDLARKGQLASIRLGKRRRVIALRVVEELLGGPLSAEDIAELTGPLPRKPR